MKQVLHKWMLVLVFGALIGCLSSGSAMASPSDGAMELPQTAQATKAIKVVVTDATGESVPGAIVSVKSGAAKAVATDDRGNATIAAAVGETIVVKMMTYVTHEAVVRGNETTINVVLKDDSKVIDEVVVIGYGKQKRSGMVSSINTVTAKEIKMPTRNLTNSLAGQMAGVIAIQRSGEPGYDDAQFFIRGMSSYSGGTNPLVLVDGVPRKMQDVSTEEIDTFSVLKDAAATAVYGAEGANGVILITTRRGQIGKPRISVSGEYSILTPTRLPEFMGSVDFMETYNEAKWNFGEEDQWSAELINKYRTNADPDLYPNTRWLDMLRDYTNNQRYNVSFSGGTEAARYFVSAQFYNENGIFKQNKNAEYNNNIGLNRYSLRSNVDLDVSKTTILRVNISGQYVEANYPGVGTGDIFGRMTTISPYLIPFVYSDGTVAGHPRPSGNRVNPYNLLMNSGYKQEWRTQIQSKVELEQKLDFITKGLMIRGAVSYDADMTFTTARTKTPSQYFATGRNADGKLILDKRVNGSDILGQSDGSSGNKRIYIDASINWNRTFAEKHDVTAMVLYMQKETQYHNASLPYRKQGLVGRVVYSYDGRYNIEGNFGYTGSETFAKGSQFGFFPAVGASWYVSNEHFYTGAIKEFMPKLKFRASYGITGNDDTGGARFLYRGTMKTDGGQSNLGWNDNGGLNNPGAGIIQGRFESPLLSWETETKQNYGIDIALFGGKIDISADYFDNLREGILLQRRTVSNSTGFSQMPWQNFGKVSNKGFDASVVYNQKFGDVSLNFRGNVTYARNKIVEYDEVAPRHDWMRITGTRIGEKNLYQGDGFYTYEDFNITGTGRNREYTLKQGVVGSTLSGALRPGDFKYKDMNNDGTIDQFDQVYGGNPDTPELVYGFGLNVEWKGLYVSVFFQGSGNTSTVLGGSNSQGFFPFSWGFDESTIRTVVANRWSDRGPIGADGQPTLATPNWNAEYPRLRPSGYTQNQVGSTNWLRDASFLRLKNAEIGYNFPKSLLQKIGFTSARVYLMGYNLAVWDKIKMWDPEMGNNNAGLNYPLPTTFTIGLEFSL